MTAATLRILALPIRDEHDVVAARQRARQIAVQLGFDSQDQTRIATAVSEIARNAYRYAGGGRVDFVLEGKTAPQVLAIGVRDEGPGIADLPRIDAGQYRSSTGMGLGIVGARRLMDQVHITSTSRGTSVWLRKMLPAKAPFVPREGLFRIVDTLVEQAPHTPLEELQQQNQELVRALDDLRTRQEELRRLNRELEDTNRGVVALYAELDEKADHLRRADEMKSRFLSNMSHEFRTPLNSVLALAGLLLSRADGPLTPEQDRQVGYIRKAAEDLSELVNDLLDLAKVEAGKIVVHPGEFSVGNLFGALRGMLRPLLVNESVALVFEAPDDLPAMVTDESKVSQILRNFISNALKFTEHGEVRVRAAAAPDGHAVVFSVADTGIGIAKEDQDRIFEEFTQLEHPAQRKVRGTGLGLPLTRKLAELLGGRIELQSEPGVGSTFSATIPLVYPGAAPEAAPVPREWVEDASRLPVLVVEDDPRDAMIVDRLLQWSPYQPHFVRTIREAQAALVSVRPCAIILDIRLRGEDSWSFLVELKAADETRRIPVIVATSIDDQQKGLGLGAEAYAVKPLDRAWLIDTLRLLTADRRAPRVLIIDDDEASRYVLRSLLAKTGATIIESSSGRQGLRLARDERPDAIFVDLVMPDMSGFEVLEQLAGDPEHAAIPRIVFTSKAVTPEERATLACSAVAVLSKSTTSPEAALAEVREALELAGIGGGLR